MKFLTITIFSLLLSPMAHAEKAKKECLYGVTQVDGYTKDDGTVVKAHTRCKPKPRDSKAEVPEKPNAKVAKPKFVPVKPHCASNQVAVSSYQKDDGTIVGPVCRAKPRDNEKYVDQVAKKPAQTRVLICKAGDVLVQSYKKANGTIVDAHCRTAADGDLGNNYGKAEYKDQPGIFRDADKDGIPNDLDRDDDNNGISDNGNVMNTINCGINEMLEPALVQNGRILRASRCMRDSDYDGKPDYLDRDGNNDGIDDHYQNGSVIHGREYNRKVTLPSDTQVIIIQTPEPARPTESESAL